MAGTFRPSTFSGTALPSSRQFQTAPVIPYAGPPEGLTYVTTARPNQDFWDDDSYWDKRKKKDRAESDAVIAEARAMQLDADDKATLAAGAGLGLVTLGAIVIGALVIPTFVVYPLIIGAFKPEWSYGRRVLAGMGISIVLGTVTTAARLAGGGGQQAMANPRIRLRANPGARLKRAIRNGS